MRQLAREWAAEGAQERAESFGPLLEGLEAEFGSRFAKDSSLGKAIARKDLQVLVPGSGLGRLPLEIVARWGPA